MLSCKPSKLSGALTSSFNTVKASHWYKFQDKLSIWVWGHPHLKLTILKKICYLNNGAWNTTKGIVHSHSLNLNLMWDMIYKKFFYYTLDLKNVGLVQKYLNWSKYNTLWFWTKQFFLLHKWKHVGKIACHHAYQTYETVALMRFVMEVVEPYTGLADVMTFEV